LDLVYIDIYGSFPTASWNGHEYFITCTDNYSHYEYLKSQSLDIFKIYKTEVENQLNRKIKAVRSDHDGETMADMTHQADIQDILSIF